MDHKARTMFSQHVSIKRSSHTLCMTWSILPPLISVLTVNLFELVRVVQHPARTHQRYWHYYCWIQKETEGKQCLALKSNCCFMWSGCWKENSGPVPVFEISTSLFLLLKCEKQHPKLQPPTCQWTFSVHAQLRHLSVRTSVKPPLWSLTVSRAAGSINHPLQIFRARQACMLDLAWAAPQIRKTGQALSLSTELLPAPQKQPVRLLRTWRNSRAAFFPPV